MRSWGLGLAVVAALALAGCGTALEAPTTGAKMTWIRADGQPIRASSPQQAQAEADRTACASEKAKAADSGGSSDAGSDCMTQRGYLLVPEDQAEAKRAELAAAAEQKRKQETAALEEKLKQQQAASGGKDKQAASKRAAAKQAPPAK